MARFYKKINIKNFSLILIFLALNLLAFQTALAAGSSYDQIIKDLWKTSNSAGYPVAGEQPKQEFVQAWSNYLNGFMILIGALFMVLIIYAGYLWMTAQGKEEQVGRAKLLILSAIIGIAVIIAGRLIAELVITSLGGLMAGTVEA